MTPTTVGNGLRFCSFCGKPEDQVALLVTSNSSLICDSCIEICSEIFQRKKAVSKGTNVHSLSAIKVGRASDGTTLTPRIIHSKLDEFVIAQSKAKKVISVAIHNHIKRMNYLQSDSGKNGELTITKSNILMFGPTGCGKTLIAQVVAETCGLPLIIVDATSLTETGYVGDDVDICIARLLQACNYDVERARYGIVCIDEIDKLAKKSDHLPGARDVSGEGVQQGLLKLIEGTQVHVPIQNNKRQPGNQETIPIDTSNILFIMLGAFAELPNIVKTRLRGVHTIGFAANLATKEDPLDPSISQYAEPEDFIKYGLIPEFVSRMPVLAPIGNLGAEDLVRVMVEPKNSLIKQYKKLFELDGVNLEFDPETLSKISELALKRKVGARGLRAIMEQILLEYMYEIPDQKSDEIQTLTIDLNRMKIALNFE